MLPILIVGAWGVLALRKRYKSGHGRGADSDVGMGSLEDLRRNGLITEDEFKRLRMKVLEKHMGSPIPQKPGEAAKPNELTPGEELTDFNIGSEGDAPPREEKTE